MKNGFAVLGIILGIVIGAFIVGGAAYLYNRSNQTTSTTTPSTPTAEPTTPTSEQSTPDETAGWKTYTNAKYGYQVKYPSDWKTQAYGDGSSIIAFADPTDSDKVVQIEVDNSNPNKLAILDWIKAQQWPDPTPVDQQFKSVGKVGGVDAYEQSTTGTVYFTNGTYIYTVENGVGFERKIVTKQIFDGFLSTFKFAQ